MISSGIDKLINSQDKYAVSFDNTECPMCGMELCIETVHVKSNIINTKYYCPNCSFECPIHRDQENISPVYDNSIGEFIKNFGEPKKKRR